MLEWYTPEQEAAILADLQALEGINSPEAETTGNEVQSDDNTKNPVVTDDTAESEDTTNEDEDDSYNEPSNEELETETVKSEAQIRKEVERELKKKYLSQVNKKDKELQATKEQLDSLKAAWYDDDSIEAVRKIVKAELMQESMTKLEITEKNNFIKKFNPDKTELKQVEEIKADFPSMSWEAARKFYYANEKPEALIKPKSPNLWISWDVPKEISDWPKVDEQAEFIKKVMAEANWAAWRR